MRSGSRCVCTSSAFGYSASSVGQAPDVPRRLEHPALRRGASTAGAAGSGGASGTRAPCRPRRSSSAPYDGTRYCVGKITLRKSLAVMRTHSCASRAPIGCIDLKPGMTSSTHVELRLRPRRCADRSRRSPSRAAGSGWSTSQVSGTRFAGSCASRSCRIVVPVRPWPTMTIGGVTSARAISGWLLVPVDDAQPVRQVARGCRRPRPARRSRSARASLRSASTRRSRPSRQVSSPRSSSPVDSRAALSRVAASIILAASMAERSSAASRRGQALVTAGRLVALRRAPVGPPICH